MITYKIDESQLADLQKRLDPDKYQKAIDIALFNIGQEMSRDAKQKAPYDTGTLRKSIESHVEPGKWVEVGTDVVYAAIHEFGGRTGRNNSVLIKAKPYLKPAFETQTKGRAIDEINKQFSKILNG